MKKVIIIRKNLFYIILTPLIYLTLATTVSAVELPGTIQGEYSVDSYGASAYDIDIKVPEGINGIKPSLGVSYNSRTENGLVGVGWSLSGLQAITRGPATIMKDGFLKSVSLENTDRFMLNGDFLILLSSDSSNYGKDNTVYRTEHDDFTKVVAYGQSGNGPKYFLVFTKSGLIMRFGGTEMTFPQLLSHL
ncbi:MAG TPA: SpvB/TcaC N-terminal domain-containing protein [Desulfomonilia bacterium]